MAQTTRDFVRDAYQLVSASSPTVPLHGDDQDKGIQFMNELLAHYAANGLVMTVNKTVTYTITQGTQDVTFGIAGSGADVTDGYLSYLQSAWVELDGVTYPLIHENRNVFNQSFKFDPLLGLPRFCIMNYSETLSTMRIYPAPSQSYDLNVVGKFSVVELTSNDDMSAVPFYFIRYLKYALARELAFYKARSEAWDSKLQGMYKEAYEDMVAATPMNVKTFADKDSMLNGADRVRAGV